MDNIQKKQAPNYTFALIVMFAVMFRFASSFVIRVTSSFAAFSVNVAMKMLSGLTLHSSMR